MGEKVPDSSGNWPGWMGRTEEDQMHRPHMMSAISSSSAGFPSRRHLLSGLAGLGLSMGVTGYADPGFARKRKGKRKKKVKKNFFGCVDVGLRCENPEQCCSGICTGKKGKKTCQPHGQSTCQAGQHICQSGSQNPCTTIAGDDGVCSTTTGNAPFCGVRGDCFTCRRDTDCELFFGKGAACAICAMCGVTGGTACHGIEPLAE